MNLEFNIKPSALTFLLILKEMRLYGMHIFIILNRASSVDLCSKLEFHLITPDSKNWH